MRKYFYVIRRRTTGEFLGLGDREHKSLTGAYPFNTERQAKESLIRQKAGNSKWYEVVKVAASYELAEEKV